MAKYDDLGDEQLRALLRRRDAQVRLGLVWERDEIEAERARNDDLVVPVL